MSLMKLLGLGRHRPQTSNWNRIGKGTTFGDRTDIGSWTKIGKRCRIGRDVSFGSWAHLGDDVIIGDGVVLGSHTRIADGVKIPAFSIVSDSALVTKDGIFENRCSGFSMSCSGGHVLVGHVSGHYRVPMGAAEFEGDAFDRVSEILDDYQWGKDEALAAFRVDAPEGEARISPLDS